MAEEKVSGTIYSLVLKREDSKFTLSLKFRGKIETTSEISKLDTDLITKEALKIFDEFRIPCSNPALNTLVGKLIRRFSKKRTKAKKQKQKGTLPLRPDEPVVSIEIPQTEELAEVVDELTPKASATIQEGIITKDMEIDSSSLNEEMLRKISLLIQPLQNEVQQLSKRLSLLEARLREQTNLSILIEKVESLEKQIGTLPSLKAQFTAIEKEIQTLGKIEEGKVVVSDQKEEIPQPLIDPTQPNETSLENEVETPVAKIAMSDSFQELVQFSEELDAGEIEIESPDTVEDPILYAQSLWKEGWQEKAIQFLEEGLRAHQNNPELPLLLGKFHSQQGHVYEAVETYERGLSFFPKNVKIILAIGEAHFALGQDEKAVHYLSKAQKLAPKDKDIHGKLSKAYMRLGQQKKAMEELGHAVDIEDVDDSRIDVVAKSSEPLSLKALKNLDLVKESKEPASNVTRKKEVKPVEEDPEKRKQKLKTLLELEDKKSK